MPRFPRLRERLAAMKFKFELYAWLLREAVREYPAAFAVALAILVGLIGGSIALIKIMAGLTHG